MWCDDWVYKIYEICVYGGFGKKILFEKVVVYQGVVCYIEDEVVLNVFFVKFVKGGGICCVCKVGVDVDNVCYMLLGL